MFGFSKKSGVNVNTTEIIDTIESIVYSEFKPLGFRKYGRTLHRFVDGDISQAINFQCGQSYRNETHLLWVNIGIRVPECMLREFHSDVPQKKYYHEYECNIRSCLGTIKNKKQSCYDLRGNIEKIIIDIMEQIQKYVIPAFDVLNTRDAILKERRNYRQFDIINGHLICLEEAMMYGKMGDMEKAAECFNQHYKKYLYSKKPNVPHLQYLKELAEKLDIPLKA